MNKAATIKVTKREPATKGQIRDLRKSGMLPASLSTRGEDSLSISVNKADLLKQLAEHGQSSVLKLKLGSKAYNAMVKEMQIAPITMDCIHVTFQHVFLNEETKAEIPVKPHGRSAITRKGFEYFQQLDMLPVVGLPKDIPAGIDIDVSGMEAGDTLYIRDVALPKGIKTDMEEDRVVFTVSYPRAQEVVEGEEAAATMVPLVGAAHEDKPEA